MGNPPTKDAYRKTAFQNISALSSETKEMRALQLRDLLLEDPDFSCAKIIGVYSALQSEISLKRLLNAGFIKEHRVAFPRVHSDGKSMTFYHVDDVTTQLQTGSFGILEPNKDLCEEVQVDELDVVLVPGVAFTVNGCRLGRGGGFYDRALEGAVNVRKIGVAFQEQIFDVLPILEHDIQMDKVIYV